MSTTSKGDREHRRRHRERGQKKRHKERSLKRDRSKKKGRHDQNQIPSSSSSSLEYETRDRHERPGDDGSRTSGDNNERSNHRHHRHHRHRRSRSEKKHSKKKRRRTSVSIDSGSSSSGSSDGGQNPPKRTHSKKKAKKSKRRTHDREHRRIDSYKKGLDLPEEKIPKKSLQFASTLQSLLQHHPVLSTDLPYLLIRLASGSGLDLRSMPPHAFAALAEVLKSMGCTLNSVTNCWEWKGGEDLKGLLNADDKSLLLVKMARCLLDGVGVTIEAVRDFENAAHRKEVAANEIPVQGKLRSKATTTTTTKSITAKVEEEEDTQTGEIALLTTMLLDKFNKCHHNTGNNSKSSLAKEVFDIVTMILDGESICLDGIPNDSLKKSLETLFLAVGLTKEEMIEEEEEDEVHEKVKEEEKQYDNDIMKKSDELEKVEGGSIAYGYTLPEEIASKGYASVKMKLDAVISACKFRHQSILQSQSKARVLGPAMPLPSNPPPNTGNTIVSREESDTDDDGPVPLGSKMINRTNTIAKKKISQLAPATSRNGTGKQKMSPDGIDADGRESWMLEPGEHDFLTGIMASGTIQNRKFQNQKTQGRYDKSSTPVESTPLDPKVQLEVDDILKAHAQARGPSLIQQHRENKMKKDADASEKGTEWGWSRDKDLDKDRRVDKQHLSLVLGGASQELKEKFQGGFSRSFM